MSKETEIVERILRDTRQDQLARGHDWDVADVLPVVIEILRETWDDGYTRGQRTDKAALTQEPNPFGDA